MKIRIWIAYSLLLSFFVLLTPRTIWHSCKHETHSCSNQPDDSQPSIHLEKKSCFACDFDLGFIDQPSSILTFKFKKYHPTLTEKPFFSVETKSIPLFSKRGPPTV